MPSSGMVISSSVVGMWMPCRSRLCRGKRRGSIGAPGAASRSCSSATGRAGALSGGARPRWRTAHPGTPCRLCVSGRASSGRCSVRPRPGGLGRRNRDLRSDLLGRVSVGYGAGTEGGLGNRGRVVVSGLGQRDVPRDRQGPLWPPAWSRPSIVLAERPGSSPGRRYGRPPWNGHRERHVDSERVGATQVVRCPSS